MGDATVSDMQELTPPVHAMYYGPNGTPLSVVEWLDLITIRDRDPRLTMLEQTHGFVIRTQWHGTDSSVGAMVRPTIWTTTLVGPSGVSTVGHWETHKQARAGHKRWTQAIRQAFTEQGQRNLQWTYPD